MIRSKTRPKKPSRKPITVEEARKVWSYDARLGNVHWIEARGANRFSPARPPGSIAVGFLQHKGIGYSAAKVALALTTGEWPGRVRHADGDMINNRIENLLDGSKEQEMVTLERFNQVLRYEPETGDFYWLQDVGRTAKAGDKAGTIKRDNKGKEYIRIVIDGHPYGGHNLAHLAMKGRFLKAGLEIDHEDGDGLNNRWENLKPCTHKENMKNQLLRSLNTSGKMGVGRATHNGKWYAQIGIDGSKKHLGYFDDKADAIAAREAAEIKYGYHPNHGKR